MSRRRNSRNLYEKYGFAVEEARARAVEPPPLVLPTSIIPDPVVRNGRPIFFAYGRVSTADQICDTQKMQLEGHYKSFLADEYAWGEFFADPDISGSIDIGAR